MKVLEGIRVLDLSVAMSGPFAAMKLADLGADVIKVERPGTGDDSRANYPIKNGESGYFAAYKLGLANIRVARTVVAHNT